MTMEAKSYSRKQAGVIYRAVKEGKIEMTKAAVSLMYDYVGHIEICSQAAADIAATLPHAVRCAVDAIFADDYETAQTSIDNINSIAA